jgi:5-methylcytosine-specific restriction endonuclease McrA
MEDIFKDDWLENSRKLALHNKLGKIISMLTFGLISNAKKIQYYSEECIKSEKSLQRYNKLINEVEELDKPRGELVGIEGVRVSKPTYADIDLVHKAGYGSDWEVLTGQILERDDRECQEQDGYCNGALQVHHKVPLSKGGTNELENLITLCKYHHSLKHEHMRKTL